MMKKEKFLIEVFRSLLVGLIIISLITGFSGYHPNDSFRNYLPPEHQQSLLIANTACYVPVQCEIKLRSQHIPAFSVNRSLFLSSFCNAASGEVMMFGVFKRLILYAESSEIITPPTDLIFPFHYFL